MCAYTYTCIQWNLSKKKKKGNNHTTRQRKTEKQKLNFKKLKAQIELAEDSATCHTTKYQERDLELFTEIKELCPTITQFLSEL